MKKGALLLLVLAAVGCPRGEAPSRRAETRRDVVLVTIDTLRSDATGFGGNSRVRTPNLDRIAREGTVFANAHAHNVVTLPSHVNILTGLLPYQHGVRDNDGFRLDAKIPTAATFFKSAGYATAAFIGAFPLDSRFGLARDFDVYDQHYPEGAHAYDFVMPERPAPEVVAAALEWFRQPAAAPRFLWVHLYDCHAPYRPPAPFDAEFRDSPYLGEVSAVDAALGPLFEALRSDPRGVFLVVTGDHGEALGDHGELTHGLFAYEATLHIPLVVWSSRETSGKTDRRLARHIDIVPTLLAQAGLPPKKELPGADLLGPPAAKATSYFEALSASLNRGWAPLRGVLGEGRKYVDLPIPELYDEEADPAEAHNVFESRKAEARSLRQALPADMGTLSRQAPGAEEVARLRSLGYLSGGAAAKKAYTAADDPKSLIAVDSALHRVIDLYQRKKLEEAIGMAQWVVAQRPAMAAGYDFLSFLQEQAGDDSAAVATLRAADRRGILSEDLKSRLGLLLTGSGRAREALVILEPLSGSTDPEVLNALGIARVGAGDFAGGMNAFRSAASLAPQDAVTWQNMGIAELQAGRTAEAIETFEKAFRVNDRLPRAWNAYGVALERSGRARDAIKAWS
ncbi:MAG TPA: sulfatase-like hydrolase/transferase, partial [Thermoanaerobaculia bacterium]|nr:sulfatase-like hydrolase/transferase [Thermoanaerobaculia bacterium]